MTLKRIRNLPEADAVLSRVDPQDIEAIDGGRSLTWMDSRPLERLSAALLDVLGPEGFKEFFAQQVTVWSESKLFGPIMASARRIFGKDPAGQFKWIARGWQVTTRNMGSVTTESHENTIRIYYANLPPRLRVERTLYSVEGSLLGMVRAQPEDATVEIDASRLEDGRITCTIRW